MPKPYSIDLRARVIEDVETGASRREAAERYGISPSVVVIWVQRFEETGSVAAKPSGGSTSPLEQARGISAGADCRAAGHDAGRDRRGDAQTKDRWQPQRGVAVLRSAQHQLQKKLCTRRSRSARTWPAHAGAGCASKACLTRRGWCSSTKPARTPRWCGCAAALRVASGSSTTRRMEHWKTITFVGGLRQRGMTAPFVIEGAMNGPMFLAYVKQCLVPTLKRGEIVLMDNLPVHKVAGVARGDRSSGRDADLSSEVFAGPQPDRAGLQQTQGASAQGGRAYDPAPLASDRSRRYRFQPARMQEFLSPCGLCSNMTGIRSSRH